LSTDNVTFGAGELRLDLVHRADGDAEDPNLVAYKQTVGVHEIR